MTNEIKRSGNRQSGKSAKKPVSETIQPVRNADLNQPASLTTTTPPLKSTTENLSTSPSKDAGGSETSAMTESTPENSSAPSAAELPAPAPENNAGIAEQMMNAKPSGAPMPSERKFVILTGPKPAAPSTENITPEKLSTPKPDDGYHCGATESCYVPFGEENPTCLSCRFIRKGRKVKEE
jgi:hypothetical protein